MQSMYDKGYVLVSIHDLVKEVTDENGNVTYEAGDIMLPSGKIPFVLSQDDVSYYEYMEDTGFARKLSLTRMESRPANIKMMTAVSVMAHMILCRCWISLLRNIRISHIKAPEAY